MDQRKRNEGGEQAVCCVSRRAPLFRPGIANGLSRMAVLQLGCSGSPAARKFSGASADCERARNGSGVCEKPRVYRQER